MKRILSISFLFLFTAINFSCKRNIESIYYKGGTPPVLAADKASIPMSLATSGDEAVKISWTNPNYQFTTGISSQDVSYLLEIDTTGSNFTNPNRKQISISRELSLLILQSEMNDYLLNQLGLKAGQPHNMEFRVTSTLVNNTVPLVSNILKFVVTPYVIPPKVTPPASGKLYITGSATPGNWMGGGDPELLSQKFTQVSPTLYVLNSIALTGGGSYLFVPLYGDWNAKYGGVGANNTNNVNGDDFKANGGDLLAPPTSGNYKIEVDFQRGKFTVTKL
jgi:hypothetical protein